MHRIGFTEKACFACTRAAADQDIEISAVLFPVKTNADILGQQLVLGQVFIPILLVQRIGVAPFCRAVFLTPAVVPACGEINTDSHTVCD